MIEKSQNKDMASVNSKENKVLEEHFFSGGMEYLPQTINAESYTQAHEQWLKTRKPVGAIIKENNQ